MVLVFLILLSFLGTFSLPKIYAISAPNFSLAQENIEVSDDLCLVYRPITIVFPDTQVTGVSCHRTGESILNDFGYDPSIFEMSSDIQQNGVRIITVVPVQRSRKLVWQTIKYPTETTYVKNITHRRKAVDQKGKNGLQGIVIEEVTYPNGKKRSTVIEKWLEKEPITEKVRVGTKYDLQKTVVDGKTIYYWKTLTVKATSYDSTCYGCNKTTATGAYLTKGIVAVDPKIIPLHTNMYIPGYGFGKAEDTGGKIKGNRIDLAYDDIRYGDWSRRWVTIYIVD